MKKGLLKKVLSVIVIVILAIIVLGVILVGLFGDRALKIGVETAATKALNVDVTLKDASLSILGGSVELKDLVISNPEGYQHESFLQLGNGNVAVNIKSLMSDTVNIKRINLDEVSLVLEQKGLTNNLQEILNSIPKGDEPKEPTEPKKEKNLVIDELEISNVDVKVKLLPVPGRADTIPLKLSPIKMTNLGTDDKLSMAELVVKILGAIAGGIAEQGMDILPAEILDPLKSSIGKAGEVLMETGKEALDKTKDLGTGILEGSKDIGKEATDAIQGLFKPKKED
jgi:hypothetical protein